jgi:hypothetical protein
MKLDAASIGFAVVALCVEVGCPQLKDDDFGSRSVNAGGGGTTGGSGGIAGGLTSSGSGGTTGTCAGGSGGCADAGRGGSAGTSPSAPIDGGTGSGCGLDEVRGPNGGCYFADNAERSWSAARTSCQSRGVGWDLVVIADAEENAFVLSITGYEAWIGATDVVSEGSWLWVKEAEPFFETDADADGPRFTNWSGGEPNDYDDSDCLRILTTGLWADFPCDSPLGHVCRRLAP